MAGIFAVLSPEAVFYQVALYIFIADSLQIFFFVFFEAIGIDESIIAGIVRRVDIDHLDFTVIGFLQDF